MKKIIQLLILILYIPYAFAQEKTITGIVSSKNNVLPFVNVSVKNTNRVTTTDVSGKYIIKASKGEVLVFSLLGFQTVEKKVRNKTTINVLLKTDNVELNEIVLVENIQVREVNKISSPEYLSFNKSKGRRKRIAKNIFPRGYISSDSKGGVK